MIKRFFGKVAARDATIEAGERRHDIKVATCALFLEMASIDGEFSEVEKRRIISRLKEDYDLSDEHADELIKAADEELKGSIDLWQFTNLINQNYSTEEKLRIIETLWEIVYADGILNKYEDYLVHKFARLLRLTHKQLIDAKMKVIHPK